VRGESYLVRLRRWVRRVCTFVLIAACVTLGTFLYFKTRHFLYYSSFFRVRDINFARDVPMDVASQLRECQELRSKRGRNLLLLDTQQVEKQLSSIPSLTAVTVSKRYPNGLLISARQRNAVAILNAEASMFLVDATGVVLEPVDAEAQAQQDLPIISGLKVNALKPGSQIDSPQLAQAIDLLQRTHRMAYSLYSRISELTIDEQEGIVLFLTGGVEVLLGKEDPIPRMVALEQYLKEHSDLKGVSSINLRFHNQLIVR